LDYFAKTNFINKDERFKSIKVCPLIYWTEDNVWDYIKHHDLPIKGHTLIDLKRSSLLMKFVLARVGD
jgi:3'-phosphoadenosine 5'-phosphosulfate sulfotransferase (PAPS reductase)/FAD synthetase